MIDLHSHILPGVDDGSRNIEDSLAILRGLEKQSITRVVLTPHYVTETNYNSSFVKNQKIFAELQKKVKAEKIKIKLHLANEIYIDPEIRKLIRTKKISGINGAKNLLIELPMSGEFDEYESISREEYEAMQWIEHNTEDDCTSRTLPRHAESLQNHWPPPKPRHPHAVQSR